MSWCSTTHALNYKEIAPKKRSTRSGTINRLDNTVHSMWGGIYREYTYNKTFFAAVRQSHYSK